MIDKLQVQHKIDQIELLQKELHQMLLNEPDNLADLQEQVASLEDANEELDREKTNAEDELETAKNLVNDQVFKLHQLTAKETINPKDLLPIIEKLTNL